MDAMCGLVSTSWEGQFYAGSANEVGEAVDGGADFGFQCVRRSHAGFPFGQRSDQSALLPLELR